MLRKKPVPRADAASAVSPRGLPELPETEGKGADNAFESDHKVVAAGTAQAGNKDVDKALDADSKVAAAGMAQAGKKGADKAFDADSKLAASAVTQARIRPPGGRGGSGGLPSVSSHIAKAARGNSGSIPGAASGSASRPAVQSQQPAVASTTAASLTLDVVGVRSPDTAASRPIPIATTVSVRTSPRPLEVSGGVSSPTDGTAHAVATTPVSRPGAQSDGIAATATRSFESSSAPSVISSASLTARLSSPRSPRSGAADAGREELSSSASSLSDLPRPPYKQRAKQPIEASVKFAAFPFTPRRASPQSEEQEVVLQCGQHSCDGRDIDRVVGATSETTGAQRRAQLTSVLRGQLKGEKRFLGNDPLLLILALHDQVMALEVSVPHHSGPLTPASSWCVAVARRQSAHPYPILLDAIAPTGTLGLAVWR